MYPVTMVFVRHAIIVCALALASSSEAAQQPLERIDATPSVSAADVDAASRRLARALSAALQRNGTVEEARASYETNPVGGGEVLGFEMMLAETLRIQRSAFRRLMESADRLTTVDPGFARRQLVMDLLDRMVAFCKANRKLGRMGEATLPGTSLPRLMDALDRSLAEMDRRIGELRPLVEAAL